MLSRDSSEIRTGCANERPSGSVRGDRATGVPTAITNDRTSNQTELIPVTATQRPTRSGAAYRLAHASLADSRSQVSA